MKRQPERNANESQPLISTRTNSASKDKDCVTRWLRLFATNSNLSELRSRFRDFFSRLRRKLDRIYEIPRS